jgi:(p)ppGpp synthase/HD superfamily hydrolase
VKAAEVTDVGQGDVDRAMSIARLYHRGQRDKGGRSYFEAHVADVHQRVTDQSAAVQVVALLHDVLEDTDCTEVELRREFPADVVDAVVAITHRPGEPRSDYYERVRRNALALMVKLADIASNTDPSRMALLDEATRDRLVVKYQAAREALS